METANEVAGLLSGFMTPLIAVIAVYIAWQQHKIARDNLRLSLYDRRLKVYRGLMDLFAVVLQDVDTKSADLGKYYADTSEKKFLFDDKIIAFMNEVREKAVELRQVKRRITRHPPPSEKELGELSDRECELLRWFDDELEKLPDRFEKPLGFTRSF
jgi:hypothetical protein